MNNEDLLTLLIAFVLGYFAHQMMRQMCGRRLVEGNGFSANQQACERFGCIGDTPQNNCHCPCTQAQQSLCHGLLSSGTRAQINTCQLDGCYQSLTNNNFCACHCNNNQKTLCDAFQQAAVDDLGLDKTSLFPH